MNLGILDLIIFSLVVIGSIAFGIFHGCQREKTSTVCMGMIGDV